MKKKNTNIRRAKYRRNIIFEKSWWVGFCSWLRAILFLSWAPHFCTNFSLSPSLQGWAAMSGGCAWKPPGSPFEDCPSLVQMPSRAQCPGLLLPLGLGTHPQGSLAAGDSESCHWSWQTSYEWRHEEDSVTVSFKWMPRHPWSHNLSQWKGPCQGPAVPATCLPSCPLSQWVLATLSKQTLVLQLLTQALFSKQANVYLLWKFYTKSQWQ